MHGGVNVVLLREVRLDLPRPEVSSLHQVDALRVFTRCVLGPSKASTAWLTQCNWPPSWSQLLLASIVHETALLMGLSGLAG